MKQHEKPISEVLLEEPERFHFFQAVRLLEKMFPEKDPVGRSATPKNELVKFRGNPAMHFPASEIRKIEKGFDSYSDEETLELMVNFMGMIGIVGVLPTPYSETIVERARYGDTALWHFTDIFTHRAVSMFFRAWEKYRFPIQYERGDDDFTASLFDFAGIGTKGLRDSLDLDPEGLLPYAGLIIQKPHSSVALELVISDYFDIYAKIHQFFGQWLELDSESISTLGLANSVLGQDAIIGTRIWDQQSKFRIILGAMSFKKYVNFLPNSEGYRALRSIVKLMTGLDLDFDIKLRLAKKDVPSCVLTTRAVRRPMLGWTSWLKSKPFEEDDEQLVLQVPQ